MVLNSAIKRRIGAAALINFFVPNAALIRGRRLIGGGAYSSKYGTRNGHFSLFFVASTVTK